MRDLSAQETTRLARVRAEAEADRGDILLEGRERKLAWLAMRREVERSIAALKSERERLGLSLVDAEARSGLKRSSLSRLENDPNANPTLFTLQRYAAALDMTLATTIEAK